ncbi:MAG: UDP-N-acetylglucosamine 1-carboxyvinyltransferase, partial [Lachnospiraceae bacterium]|nr:UDP-N-acetylglucosamine 1-carboxyvinyltransferase [Lachnospiraceae bacterium]
MRGFNATVNIILASCLSTGTTIIHNAAKEPEIVNVATFLNNAGAKIKGAGTSDITITGVKSLGSCFTEVIPDRIEAGTYIVAGALVGNKLKVENLIPEHIESFLSKLQEMGVDLKVGADYVVVSKSKNLKPVS